MFLWKFCVHKYYKVCASPNYKVIQSITPYYKLLPVLQVEPGKPGAEVSKKKTISQRKNLPIECAQGDRPARCPNHFFAVNEPSAVPWW